MAGSSRLSQRGAACVGLSVSLCRKPQKRGGKVMGTLRFQLIGGPQRPLATPRHVATLSSISGKSLPAIQMAGTACSSPCLTDAQRSFTLN